MAQTVISPGFSAARPARAAILALAPKAVTVLAFSVLIAAAMGLLMAASPGIALAQEHLGRLSRQEGTVEVLRPAAERDPRRVRNQLLAFHGFTRARLDHVSADVPDILREFISDPGASVTLRRQAIKALRLYPSEENFAFIVERLPEAPVVLQRLYVVSLGSFVAGRHERITAMLPGLLDSSDLVARHAVVGLAARLQPTEALRGTLQRRLSIEPEPSLQNALRGLLRELP